MPISGLVVTFETDLDQHTDSLRLLRNEPAIEVGESRGNKSAIVVETDSKEPDQQLWQWIRSLPGVIDLQVAFVAVDDGTDDESLDKLGLPESIQLDQDSKG